MKNYAVHPGITMKYILISMGKTQKWLSEEMNMSKVVISELINQKRNVTAMIAIAFEKASGYPADKLLKIQAEYDLYQERIKENRMFNQKTMISDDSEGDTKVFINKKSTMNLAS